MQFGLSKSVPVFVNTKDLIASDGSLSKNALREVPSKDSTAFLRNDHGPPRLRNPPSGKGATAPLAKKRKVVNNDDCDKCLRAGVRLENHIADVPEISIIEGEDGDGASRRR